MPGRPGGNTVWDKPEFLMELGIGFFSAAQASGGLNQEMRDAIIDHLQKQGFTVTWEAIRYVETLIFLCSCLARVSLLSSCEFCRSPGLLGGLPVLLLRDASPCLAGSWQLSAWMFLFSFVTPHPLLSLLCFPTQTFDPQCTP